MKGKSMFESEMEMLKELKEVNKRINEINALHFQMGMEDLQMLMRAYEMLFIGRCDLEKEALKKEMVEFIFHRIGPDKFKQWGHDAGLKDRDWNYLFKVGE